MTLARGWLMAAGGLLAAGIPAADASAQGARTCRVVIDSTGGVSRQVDIGGGLFRLYQSGGVWARCQGEPTRLYADSAAYYPELDRFDMVGNVRFRDATAQLTANRGSYYLRDERLDAFGNAVLTNVETGSRLRGPNLTYRRRAPAVRETAELTASRRPTIEWRDEAAGPESEPYVIVADRVRLVGNSQAWTGGSVTIDRSNFHARSDSAMLDTERGNGRLVGHARVEGSDSSGYTLTGREVAFRLEGNDLRWVQAEGLAESVSAAWRLVADTIQFDVAGERIQAGTAWGDSTPPRALSRMNTIVGDSLAIQAPDQQLSVVRAIGAARATARRDSVDQESDWVAGDTVVARFDTASAGALTRIDALGNGRTRYRVYEPDGVTLAGINYSRGDRIVARFRREQLDRVDVTGNADGVFLEARRQTGGAPS